MQTQNLTLDYETILKTIKESFNDIEKSGIDSWKIRNWLMLHCVGLSIDDREKLMLKLRQALWEA